MTEVFHLKQLEQDITNTIFVLNSIQDEIQRCQKDAPLLFTACINNAMNGKLLFFLRTASRWYQEVI
ncbi:hypothetical protein [Actinobacillus porcinus]|uniref:hypothetical protein n=1 Tax=Actinobacillus porcinus TaxID=51048 RepID=UPI002A91840D|nr:hypothetical protein [Actinobacillus porcinus]MDY5420547.1 hypothetical protein [Actinobacillus porcinus]